MKVSERLVQAAQPIWERMYEHPFMQGIGDGTLPDEVFAFFMRQDYPYLVNYARAMLIGSIKAPTLALMKKFSWLAESTLNIEMDLHKSNAAALGISEEDLLSTQPAPTALAYSNFLKKTAYEGSFLELSAAVLPCMFSYCVIGKRLLALGNEKGLTHPQYGEWMRTYDSPEATELGEWLAGMIDERTVGITERQYKLLERKFLEASRYDYMFLDMAWRQEKWPV